MLQIITTLACSIGSGVGIAGIIIFFKKFIKERKKILRIQRIRTTSFDDYLPMFWCFIIMVGCLCLTTIFAMAGINFLMK